MTIICTVFFVYHLFEDNYVTSAVFLAAALSF